MAPKVSRNANTLTVDERIFQRFATGQKYVIVEMDEHEKPARIVSSSPDEEVAMATLDSLTELHPESNLRVVRPHTFKKDTYVVATRRLHV